MNDSKTLREQMIDALEDYRNQTGSDTTENYIDHGIMPVLQAAMDAGELLVSRNTRPKEHIAKRVDTWVRAVIQTAQNVHNNESTVSKRELLRVLYFLAEQAHAVVRDIDENAIIV